MKKVEKMGGAEFTFYCVYDIVAFSSTVSYQSINTVQLSNACSQYNTIQIVSTIQYNTIQGNEHTSRHSS